MFTKETYRSEVERARRVLTDVAPGPGGYPVTVSNPEATRYITRPFGHGLFRLRLVRTPLTLVFRLNDLYITGFIPGDGTGPPYVFANSQFAMNTPNKLRFGDNYRSMGLWRETNGLYDLSLDQVSDIVRRVHDVRNVGEANDLQKSFWMLSIGLAEAVRFDDVLDNIVAGEQIADAQLDWSNHQPREQGRVVVIKSDSAEPGTTQLPPATHPGKGAQAPRSESPATPRQGKKS